MMSVSVEGWRFFLIAVSLLNILAWALAAATMLRRRAPALAAPDSLVLRRTLLLLSAGYVFGCAYRSCWPVVDIPRLVVVDSWMSSVIVGRSVATLAELCFVAQWALLLRFAAQATDSGLARTVSSLLLPMAVLAETCSWYSVLSTSNLGHVFEESLWGLGAALWVCSLLALRPRCALRAQRLLTLGAVLGALYVAFMFTVDVPMYWARWLGDEAAGRAYLDIAQGLDDVAGRWTVSTSWRDWGSEVAWMTPYFSVAVWLSIAVVHLPLPRPNRHSA